MSANAGASTTESTKQTDLMSAISTTEGSVVKPTPQAETAATGKRESDATINKVTESGKKTTDGGEPMRMEELRKEEEAFKEALDRMNAKIGNLHREINNAPIPSKPEETRASRSQMQPQEQVRKGPRELSLSTVP